VGVPERAAALDRLADLLEADMAALMALCVWEAGKTLPDAMADVREAVDFCRYYAQQARERLASPTLLPGPVGESNLLTLHGRGVFACISPWNFPVAISRDRSRLRWSPATRWWRSRRSRLRSPHTASPS